MRYFALIVLLAILAGCGTPLSELREAESHEEQAAWPALVQVGPYHYEYRPEPNVYCLIVYTNWNIEASRVFCVNTTEGGR